MMRDIPKHNRRVYRILEHTADLRIEVSGVDLCDLFEKAAFSLFDLMTEIEKVTPYVVCRILVFGFDVDDLFVNFMRELHGRFSADKFLMRECVLFAVSNSCVKGALFGELYDSGKHILTTEIKAVTYHGAKCACSDGKWRGTIVFDV